MKKGIEIFKHKWLTDIETSFCEKTGVWWLVYVEGEGMYCLLCRIHNTKNKFNKLCVFNQTPSTNSSKRSAITDHSKNTGHLSILTCELERRNSSIAQQHREVQETKDSVTFNAFQGCYWLAKEEIANCKLLSLIDLQKRSGVKEMMHFRQTSERSQKEMRLLIGQLIKNHLLDQIYSAKYFSILVDEVTDCSSIEQLLMYIGFVDVKGESHFKFLDCVDVLAESNSADAATITKCIFKELKASKLDTQYLCGFGSDGASVMTGDKNGVGAKLQERAKSVLRTHCISHRLALACGDANDSVKFIPVIETTLRQLWKWLEYPKRASAYVKVCASVHKINLANTETKEKMLATKIQKACRTRWLSTGNSICSVCKNFVALMQTLRLFNESDATAQGLLSRMNNVKFLGTIILLNDILPHLNALSKLFQKDHTCYASIKPALESTKAAIRSNRDKFNIIQEVQDKIQPGGMYADLELELSVQNPVNNFLINLQRSYTEALEVNLDRRFVEAPVLKAFGIFDPTTIPSKSEASFASYGNEDTTLLAQHFNMDQEETLAEWQNFKYNLLEMEIPEEVLKGKGDLSPTHYVMKKLVREQSSYRITLSNIVDLAQICLTQPLSNAVVERGASAVKRVKTRLRNSLKNDMLASLLHITINGPEKKSEDASKLLTEATSIWRQTRVRNLPKVTLPKVGGCDSMGGAQGTVSVATADTSVQTEDIQVADAVKQVDLDIATKVAADIVLRALDVEDCGSEPDSDCGMDYD